MRRDLRSRMAATVFVVAALLAGCTGQPQQSAQSPQRPVGKPAPERGFTVLASGDILIHPTITEQATVDGQGSRDYRKIFAGIKPAVSAADLALCHLEVPLASADGPFTGYPSFSAPPEVAEAIADTGYDSCSTASNHTLDQGEDGVRHTLDALDANGIKHTGSARSAAESARAPIMKVRGVRVAQLSYTFGFNGIEPPTDWIANEIDPARILADAREARAAGAQVVIVSMHWGTEDQHAVTDEQRAVARTLLADDSVDLIVGHHAHVVQPFAKVDGKWVAFGLGNSLARHDEPIGSTEEGVLARFHFAPDGEGGWKVDGARYLPTLVELAPSIRLVRLTGTAASEVPAARRTEALRRTGSIVGSLGAQRAGLRRG